MTKKQKAGVVVSNRMDRTVNVLCERKLIHPKYKKVVKITSKFKAHDEEKKCQVGDLVLIEETRPYAADKFFRVVRVIGRGEAEKKELPKKKEKKISDTAA